MADAGDLKSPARKGMRVRPPPRAPTVRVNKRWRLIFQWDGGKDEASGVYLDDHSYN